MVFLTKERLDVFLKRQVIQNYLSGQNKHMKNLKLLSLPPLHIITINNCHKDLTKEKGGKPWKIKQPYMLKNTVY